MWQRNAAALARPRRGCVDHRWSSKMGRLVALNGRNTASIVAYFLDRDPTIAAWWHQPFEYQWKTVGPNGKATGTKRHEPQFVVLRDDGFTVLDFAKDSELIARSEAGQDYELSPQDQSWRWLTAEREYTSLGLHYEVHSTSSIPCILHQNLRDLDRYQDDLYQLSVGERDRLLGVFAREGILSIRDCVDAHEIPADAVRRALVEGLIVADLVHTHLVNADCLVFRDPILLDGWLAAQVRAPGLPLPTDEEIDEKDMILYRGKTYAVRLVDGDDVILQGIGDEMQIASLKELKALKAHATKGQAGSVLEPTVRLAYVNLTDAERELGLARLNLIEGKPQVRIQRPSERTLQRWRGIANGETSRIRKIVALGRNRRPGNRSERFTKRHEVLVRWIVRKHYDRNPHSSKVSAYAAYRASLPYQEITEPMSEMAFNHRVDLYSIRLNKYGKRAAYQRSNLSGVTQFNNSPHGVLPHQVVHVDHTEVDVDLICPDGRNLNRAWLTLFWDASLKRARAMVLTFRKPNTDSILLGIRDYANRWKCLPKLIVVDGAAELKTANVRELETAYGIEVRTRKGSEGRSGSPIENRIGSRERESDQQMHGNTSHLKAARAYTGRISPKDDAEWTLPALYKAYELYFFEYLGKVYVDPCWGKTPEAYEKEVRRYCGEKDFIQVEYDFSLVILTAPIVPPRERLIQKQGVQANYAYYTNSAIRRLKPGDVVSVRGEPHCANIVYVRIGGKWTIAVARDLRLFEGFTMYQAAIAMQQWRRQNRSLWRKSKRSPRALELRNALLNATGFDPRLLALQQHEEAVLRDESGMDVSLDETGELCLGGRKSREASRGRAEYAASSLPRGGTQTEIPAPPRVSESLPRGAVFASSTHETPQEATDPFTAPSLDAPNRDAAQKASVPRRRRPPRLLGVDAWKKTGFV